MAMRRSDVERLLHEVRMELGAGASEEGIRAELFDVVHEFLDLSNAWYEYIALPIQPNTISYAIYPKAGGMINRLIAAWDQNFVGLNGSLSFGIPPGAQVAGVSQAGFTSPPGAVFSLVYPQIQTFTAQVLVAKNVVLPTVKDDLPDAPDWLLPKWSRYFKHGLVGVMAMHPKKPYTNAEVAKYNLAKFQMGAAMASTEAKRSYTYGGQAWRYPGGWRTSTQRGGVSTAYPWIGR